MNTVKMWLGLTANSEVTKMQQKISCTVSLCPKGFQDGKDCSALKYLKNKGFSTTLDSATLVKCMVRKEWEVL